MKRNLLSQLRNLLNRLPVFITIAVCMFLPWFVTNNYYMLIINEVLIFIVAVLGMNFITGLAGENNMGMAGLFAIGAYCSAILTIDLNLSPFIALLICIPVGMLFGQILGRPSLRVKGVYLALTTMMFGEVVRLVINNLKITNGSNGLRNIPKYSFFGFVFETYQQQFYLYFAICLLALWISHAVVKGRFGREFQAIRDNEDGVESCGVNIVKVKLTAFTLCTVFGCVAGAMWAHLIGYVNPNMFSFDFMIKFFMVLMLGGIGSVPGIIFGAIIVVVLPEVLRFMQDYYLLVYGAIALLFVLFMPYGMASAITMVKQKIITASQKRKNAK